MAHADRHGVAMTKGWKTRRKVFRLEGGDGDAHPDQPTVVPRRGITRTELERRRARAKAARLARKRGRHGR